MRTDATLATPHYKPLFVQVHDPALQSQALAVFWLQHAPASHSHPLTLLFSPPLSVCWWDQRVRQHALQVLRPCCD